jgi:hypothetical protein
MHFIMNEFGREVLLDEPVVRRWDSLPLLRSCKVRLAKICRFESVCIGENLDE